MLQIVGDWNQRMCIGSYLKASKSHVYLDFLHLSLEICEGCAFWDAEVIFYECACNQRIELTEEKRVQELFHCACISIFSLRRHLSLSPRRLISLGEWGVPFVLGSMNCFAACIYVLTKVRMCAKHRILVARKVLLNLSSLRMLFPLHNLISFWLGDY